MSVDTNLYEPAKGFASHDKSLKRSSGFDTPVNIEEPQKFSSLNSNMSKTSNKEH